MNVSGMYICTMPPCTSEGATYASKYKDAAHWLPDKNCFPKEPVRMAEIRQEGNIRRSAVRYVHAPFTTIVRTIDVEEGKRLSTGMFTCYDGTLEWYKNGVLHRDADLPAVILLDGTRKWYVRGKISRLNALPAVLKSNGKQTWYHDNVKHRDGDLPAVISAEKEVWYQHGSIHRGGDLPAIVYTTGDKAWYKRGNLHRDGDMPAYITQYGDCKWYKHSMLHRDGGLPAIVTSNGHRRWYQFGVNLATPG